MTISGALLIDKPQWLTSHDVVNKVRQLCKTKKVGHTGTLDPLATGLLVILVGKATKLARFLETADKDYLAEMIIGQITDTQDSQGKIVSSKNAKSLTKEKIRENFDLFKGEIEQVPPMVSAIKINGQKLYRLARKGEVIKRKARKVKIYELGIKEIALDNFPKVSFFVSCSKGTYVRTLCHDTGLKLGYGAHLSALRRTRLGKFNIKEATTLNSLIKSPTKITSMLIPPGQLINFAAVKVNLKGSRQVKNGLPLTEDSLKNLPTSLEKGQYIKVMDGNNLLSVYQVIDLKENKLTAKAKIVL